MPRKRTNQINLTIDEMHNYDILFDNREIFLHGFFDSDSDPGVEYRNANKFIKNLRLLEQSSNDIIVVHQHNIGGNWDCGIMIYDAIKICECPIVFVCHGIAASMGGIILQAADLRVLMPHCDFLIHDGYSALGPDLTVKQAKSWAAWEKKLQDEMLNIYLSVCKEALYFQEHKISDIKKFIRGKLDKHEDWWLTPKEAVNYGFADIILGEEVKNIKEVKEYYVKKYQQ